MRESPDKPQQEPLHIQNNPQKQSQVIVEDTNINSTDRLQCGWGMGWDRIRLSAKMTNRNCKATSLLPTFFLFLSQKGATHVRLLYQSEKACAEKENTWINSKTCFFDL